MNSKKLIAKALYKAVSNRTLSFNKAIRVYDKLNAVLARSKSPSARFCGRHVNKHLISATMPGSRAMWSSVLFPAEILVPFGLKAVTLEVIAGVFSTLGLSREFLDSAERNGAPLTMCSFHRMLLGISKQKFIGRPFAVGATSLLCDGNVKSFAEVAKEHSAPFFFIDIPYENSASSIKYVKEQLYSICERLAGMTGVLNYEDAIKKVVTNANKSFELLRRFYELRKKSYKNLYCGHETANFAFPNHFMLGDPNLLTMLEARCKDVEAGIKHNRFYRSLHYNKNARRLMWLHIVPQYDNLMWEIIDDGVKARVVCDEYSSPYFEDYDINDPLASIARRLIEHPSNGRLERRIEHILKVARDFKVDGMIHYSSWGCHQAAGNVHLLGKKLQEKGYKFLNINGDAVDENNLSFEQHRTRLEAFLEN